MNVVVTIRVGSLWWVFNVDDYLAMGQTFYVEYCPS